MKNTVLLSGALSLGFAIVASSAFAQAPAEKEVAPTVSKTEAISAALLTDPENPVVIAEDDAKDARKEMSKAPFDMETLKGKSYTDCKVLKVDPDGLFFRHSRGMAKLSFADLPEDVRDRFDYDSDKADQFIKKHRAVMAKVAKQREQQTIIVNNNAPQFGGGGYGYGGFGSGYNLGSSQFGFPYGFPFGIPRSDAAAPYFGYPNVSFQAGTERRAGSPIAPGLMSQGRFQDIQSFVQDASGYPAPRGVQSVQQNRLGGAGPGTFRPTPQIYTSPRPQAPSGGGGIGLR